jgi:hypothetical protein
MVNWRYIKIQSLPRSKHYVSVIKTSQLMLYGEIIAVFSQIHTKHINTLCGQNVAFVNVQPLWTMQFGHALLLLKRTNILFSLWKYTNEILIFFIQVIAVRHLVPPITSGKCVFGHSLHSDSRKLQNAFTAPPPPLLFLWHRVLCCIIIEVRDILHAVREKRNKGELTCLVTYKVGTAF